MRFVHRMFRRLALVLWLGLLLPTLAGAEADAPEAEHGPSCQAPAAAEPPRLPVHIRVDPRALQGVKQSEIVVLNNRGYSYRAAGDPIPTQPPPESKD